VKERMICEGEERPEWRAGRGRRGRREGPVRSIVSFRFCSPFVVDSDTRERRILQVILAFSAASWKVLSDILRKVVKVAVFGCTVCCWRKLSMAGSEG